MRFTRRNGLVRSEKVQTVIVNSVRIGPCNHNAFPFSNFREPSELTEKGLGEVKPILDSPGFRIPVACFDERSGTAARELAERKPVIRDVLVRSD